MKTKTLKIIVTAMSIMLLLLTGCQPKEATAQADIANSEEMPKETTTQADATNPGGSVPQQRKQIDPAEMKKRMEANINELVTDGTLTKEQADKVLEVMLENQKRSSSQNNISPGSNQGNGQSRQRISPLSELVKEGTITQEQADAVMEKTRGNFRRNNGGSADTQKPSGA